MFLDGFRGYVACCLNVVNVLTVAPFFYFGKLWLCVCFVVVLMILSFCFFWGSLKSGIHATDVFFILFFLSFPFYI